MDGLVWDGDYEDQRHAVVQVAEGSEDRFHQARVKSLEGRCDEALTSYVHGERLLEWFRTAAESLIDMPPGTRGMDKAEINRRRDIQEDMSTWRRALRYQGEGVRRSVMACYKGREDALRTTPEQRRREGKKARRAARKRRAAR